MAALARRLKCERIYAVLGFFPINSFKILAAVMDPSYPQSVGYS